MSDRKDQLAMIGLMVITVREQIRRIEYSRALWKYVAIFQLTIIPLFFLHNYINLQKPESTSASHKNNFYYSNKNPTTEIGVSRFIATDDFEKIDANLQKLTQNLMDIAKSQTSNTLLKDIQTKWLNPPSNQPYNFTPGPDTGSNITVAKPMYETVMDLLRQKRNGFFIDYGANDGVFLSNTLHLEQEYGWSGLLLEPDPIMYQKLLQRHRKAWSINACLSPNLSKAKVPMSRFLDKDGWMSVSNIAIPEMTKLRAEQFALKCFPLTSILLAMNQSFAIDYLNVNIKSGELKILETIPWDFLFIKVVTIQSKVEQGEELTKFMALKNYRHVTLFDDEKLIRDYVFIHYYLERESNSRKSRKFL